MKLKKNNYNTVEIIPKSAKRRSARDIAVQQKIKDSGPLPAHIAIIMDGNGRWAKKRGKNRILGHREGTKSVRDITEACAELGVSYLTLYTFSTENWNRPVGEVNALMELLVATIRREVATLNDNNIRVNAIGDLSRLPEKAANEMVEAMRSTADNTRMTLTLALSYSGRQELTRMVEHVARDVKSGTLNPEDVDEKLIESHLYTSEYPDPELMIRTGGETRISNFLLWQLAYAELYFTELFWPEFRRKHLYEAIESFQTRERRFGKVTA